MSNNKKQKTDLPKKNKPMRIYDLKELNKFSQEALGYLVRLEQLGVVNNINRELIINRAMTLKSPMINIHEIKWIIFLVLFNQPEDETQLRLLEDLVLDSSYMDDAIVKIAQ